VTLFRAVKHWILY